MNSEGDVAGHATARLKDASVLSFMEGLLPWQQMRISESFLFERQSLKVQVLSIPML